MSVAEKQAAGKALNFRWAITEALREEMERDATVFVAGEDVGASGGAFGLTRGLYEKFGEWRVKDTPLAEHAIAGLAVGAALGGMRPVVEIMFMDFITLAMDQIANQAAKNRTLWGGRVRMPLVVRTLCGAGLKIGGHHSASLEAWFVHVPGLKVVYPSTPADAKGLLKAAIRDDDPVVFMEHKSLMGVKGPVPEGDVVVPLGVADVKRAGRDCTVVATGWMVHRALAAAEELAASGVDVEVVDPRTLAPLDTATIVASVRKTKRLVVVQEAPAACSFASEVSAMVAEQAIDSLDAPIRRVTGAATPLPFGPLEDVLIPQVADVVAAVREAL